MFRKKLNVQQKRRIVYYYGGLGAITLFFVTPVWLLTFVTGYVVGAVLGFGLEN